MSDPNAKKMKAAKRFGRALDLIRQGLQLNQWSISKLDEEADLYIIGKPEMVMYAKEMFNEVIRQETASPVQAGSLELGASAANDSEASHAGESLAQEPASGDNAGLEQGSKEAASSDGEAA
jgi:hypothetical protein